MKAVGAGLRKPVRSEGQREQWAQNTFVSHRALPEEGKVVEGLPGRRKRWRMGKQEQQKAEPSLPKRH